MSYNVPIRAIRIEKFRGFRDPHEFNLASSAVIVTGPNGTGKTSLFDAFQWVFLGSIDRLKNIRARNSIEYVVNQYRLGEKAQVEVDLAVARRTVTIRRVGDHNGSVLEYRESGSGPLFGEAAEKALQALLTPGPELTLEMALHTSGLLQQDVMRAVLEARPADRYAHLSSLLGLARLEDFEAAVKEVAKDASDREKGARSEYESVRIDLARAEQALAEAEQRALSAPQASALFAELRVFGDEHTDLVSMQLPSIDALDLQKATACLLEVQRALDVVEKAQAAQARLARHPRPDLPEPSADELARARADADAAADRVRDAELEAADAAEQLRRAKEAADDLGRLAAAALPLLNDACPVCEQHIDPAAVEAALLRRANEAAVVTSLTAALAEKESVRTSALEDLQSAQRAVEVMLSVSSAWNEHRQAAEASNILQVQEPSRLLQLVITAKGFGDLAATREFLTLFQRRIGDLVSHLGTTPAHTAVERQRSEVASLKASLESRSSRVSREARRASQLKALADSTVAARVEVTERRFNAVQPLVANIFRRLDPHPAFKTMNFQLDTYYKRGNTSPLVYDPVANVSADPLLVFSTSQANIAALSYFLAMGLASRNSRLPFLLLDDPVQSMDDVNVLGFADLCRHLRAERQLLVSTHERRLARLLERKLAPRTEDETARVIAFTGWNRSGPIVDTYEVAPQSVDRPLRVVAKAG